MAEKTKQALLSPWRKSILNYNFYITLFEYEKKKTLFEEGQYQQQQKKIIAKYHVKGLEHQFWKL